MKRITAYVIGASALLVFVALLLGGPTMAFGATVGGVYAVLNWSAMRWLGQRLVVATDKGRMVWGALLGAKMLIAMLVLLAILSTGAVDPVGFAIGLSGLVVGILGGTFHSMLAGQTVSRGET